MHQFEPLSRDRDFKLKLVPELINFFNRDANSEEHIYAHKEYFYSNGKRETVIKSEEEIFRLLRTESQSL